MHRLTRLSLTLLAMLVLTSCSSLTIRAPICEPPPLPDSVMQPCPLPEPLADGQLATLANQMLRDRSPSGLWAQCIRQNDQLIALVKYRDQVCEKIRALNQSQSDRPWWKFWGS